MEIVNEIDKTIIFRNIAVGDFFTFGDWCYLRTSLDKSPEYNAFCFDKNELSSICSEAIVRKVKKEIVPEKRSEFCWFKKIKIGECYKLTKDSDSVFLKIGSSYGFMLDNDPTNDLKTEFVDDGTNVIPIKSKLILTSLEE